MSDFTDSNLLWTALTNIHICRFVQTSCPTPISTKFSCGTSEKSRRKSRLFPVNWSQRAVEPRLKCMTLSLASSKNFWRPCTIQYCYCQPCALYRTLDCLLWHCWQYSHAAMRTAVCIVCTDWAGFELRTVLSLLERVCSRAQLCQLMCI